MTRALATLTLGRVPQPPAARVYIARCRKGASVRATEGSLVRAASCAGVEIARSEVDQVPWHELSPDHVAAIVKRASERWAPATAAHVAYTLRAVLRVAWVQGHYSDKYMRGLESIAPRSRGIARVLKQPLSLPERERLYRACPPGEIGVRDRAVIALLDGCGVRRGELCALDLVDVDGARMRVRGKGGAIRTVPLVNDVREAVETYVRLRGNKPGPLILPWASSGPIWRRWRGEAVYRRLQWLLTRTGLRRVGPHALRAGAIGDLMDGGVDVSAIARLVGHASIATTQRYDRRPERAVERAARARSIPK
jgi:integrase